MKTILSVPISDLPKQPIDPGQLATLCRLRFLDVTAFLDSHELRIMEHPPGPQHSEKDLFSTLLPPYAAISYPWRDLQLPEGQSCPSFAVKGALHADRISIDVIRTACVAARAYGYDMLWLDRLSILQDSKQDKIWQIHHMFRVYKNCSVCLVFPGGLVRLARLDDSTTWIDRAWTLQEAAAPGAEKVKVVFQLSHSSYQDYIQHRCEVASYNEVYSQYLKKRGSVDMTINGKKMSSGQYGAFVDKVLEADRSATCDFQGLAIALWSMDVKLRQDFPEIAQDHEKFPIRILRPAETQMLSHALDFGGLRFWIAAYTRSSSRPVDMVFSLMDLLGVQVDVARFGKHDRTKATIAMIQMIMKASPKATATWLYIAPGMTPSSELSTLPQAPETSESGRAYINTARKGHTLAYEAIGAQGANFWRSDGAPRGEMTDSGYFVFWSRAALVIKEEDITVPKHKAYDNCWTWAIVVGRLKNYNRNPDTWRIQTWNPDKSPRPKGVYELTLMFVEKHGYDLYHRVGMEREIDERKTERWNWVYRRFQVGGPGRGERKRFGTSISGPVFVAGLGEEEEDTLTMYVN